MYIGVKVYINQYFCVEEFRILCLIKCHGDLAPQAAVDVNLLMQPGMTQSVLTANMQNLSCKQRKGGIPKWPFIGWWVCSKKKRLSYTFMGHGLCQVEISNPTIYQKLRVSTNTEIPKYQPMAAPLETLDSSEVSYEMSYTEGFMLHHLMGLWLKEIPMISGRSRLVGEIYASHRFPDVLFLQNIYKYTVIATLMCWGCFFSFKFGRDR